jgi:hypothetical protein
MLCRASNGETWSYCYRFRLIGLLPTARGDAHVDEIGVNGIADQGTSPEEILEPSSHGGLRMALFSDDSCSLLYFVVTKAENITRCFSELQKTR